MNKSYIILRDSGRAFFLWRIYSEANLDVEARKSRTGCQGVELGSECTAGTSNTPRTTQMNETGILLVSPNMDSRLTVQTHAASQVQERR